ncbi:MAG: IclR family transcriptional regulator [Candidatus Protistobacter heckmanni]|nr:IclR family transcriptional regulator [Candidatus Protistobacter heckmanni]
MPKPPSPLQSVPASAPTPAARSALAKAARSAAKPPARRAAAARAAHEPEPGDRQFTANLARGLEVLRAFTPTDFLLGNSELCQRTGLPKATISRLTYTLTQMGYLVRVDRLQKYRLGPEVLMLGYPMLAGLEVRHIARPHMEALARATGCTVNLGMLGRLEVVYIDALRLDRGNILQPDIGSARPLLTTSIGRALLLASPAAERTAILNRLRVANPSRFAEEKGFLAGDEERFRAEGFCLARGDFNSDIHAVAAPVRAGPRDHPLLALNCTSSTLGRQGGLRAGTMERKVAPRLLQAVRDIERAYAVMFNPNGKY